MSGASAPRGFWEHLIGFFITSKFAVVLLVGILLVAGLIVAPMDLGGGALPREPVPVDAIPDIGENQQIVFTEWPGRSPRDLEDQISYPLTTALLGISGVKTVRSFSMLGFSTIFVIFEDSVEFYWSRSRVLEKLSALPSGTLPDGVVPMLGPDATALGQVFWYTLEGHDEAGEVVGGWGMQELRSLQDWTVRYALQSVPGVSEVASVGGYVQEYQIDVDPEAMRAHEVSLGQIAAAVQGSNLDVGARTIEINKVEYLIRSLGFIKDIEDIEQAVVVQRDHVPIRVKDVARVGLGPDDRRGALDKAGAEAVGGVVVARFGENPLAVIERVKARIAEIEPGLPQRTLEDGRVSKVRIVPFYDRSTLIKETLGTLTTALWQQILITIIVVLILMRHLRSSILISAMLPMAVLTAFLAMKIAGVDANIMSLAGVAIAIGTMVDMGIVFTENIVARLNEAEGRGEATSSAARGAVVRDAAAEVAPAVLTSLSTTLVSFLPVFALTASEGKLFAPLAWTKTFAMAGAMLFALTVLPPLAHLILWPRVRALAPSEGPLWRRVVRSAARREHWRDWIMMGLGVALAVKVQVLLGLFVVLVGALRVVEGLLPARLRDLPSWLENVLAIVAMTVLLTRDWLPLGPGEGLGRNLLLVGGFVGFLMFNFLIFLKFYSRILRWALSHKVAFLLAPGLLTLFGMTTWLGFDGVFGWLPDGVRLSRPVVAVAHALPGFGREFMPPFDEGSYLFMPTTMSHASLGESLEMLQEMDAAIASIPEVDEVVGKIGRAESPLDPAPVSMVETVVNYKAEWIELPDGSRRRQWRDHIRSPSDIWAEIVKVAQLPGMTSAPELMPINTRIIMLQTGMRASMGLKIRGPDLETIEAVGIQMEGLLRQVPGVRAETVFAERIVGKPYLEFEIDREAIARYGLTVDAVQEVIQIGLGGMMLTRTVEGRERYPVRVRYMREERDSVEALLKVFVPAPDGEQIPLESLVELRYVRGPQMIKAEDTFLTGTVIFDRVKGAAEADLVELAQGFLKQKLDSGELVLPAGVSYFFTGTYENQVRSEKRLKLLVPLAMALIFVLLYFQFRTVLTTFLIYTGVGVAVSGGFILIWLYGQPWFMDFDVMGRSARDLFQIGPMNMSVAVWIGFIALIGVATDDGVVIATYLKQRFEVVQPDSIAAIRQCVQEAGDRRVLPCLMTTATTILALLPVITSEGRGSDVMVPMAIPSLGGMTIELITLFVVPVLYSAVEELRWRLGRLGEPPAPAPAPSGGPEVGEQGARLP